MAGGALARGEAVDDDAGAVAAVGEGARVAELPFDRGHHVEPGLLAGDRRRGRAADEPRHLARVADAGVTAVFGRNAARVLAAVGRAARWIDLAAANLEGRVVR